MICSFVFEVVIVEFCGESSGWATLQECHTLRIFQILYSKSLNILIKNGEIEKYNIVKINFCVLELNFFIKFLGSNSREISAYNNKQMSCNSLI